ncbi:hypothetical protein [Achromobacter insolitus]|uniref:hypothetical protein n=1 Tax=Achromobacter insolitus TaxID=217204 RepID=UPI00241E0871|nr:hypothetical protein [Achromobacter insolitus]
MSTREGKPRATKNFPQNMRKFPQQDATRVVADFNEAGCGVWQPAKAAMEGADQMMARALIISDRLSTYDCFRRTLNQYPELSIWVLDASDLRFFELEKHADAPELVILDVLASPTKCLAATARVRALFPGAKIAVRALALWERFLPLILQAGAHGIIDGYTYHSRHAMSMLIDSMMAGNIIYRARGSD